MSATVTIPAQEVTVLGKFDVVVCGGGLAGVTAAVAAARHGARLAVCQLLSPAHPGHGARGTRQARIYLGIRESRRIRGLKTLDAVMVVGARKQPDALGHGMWMIDIHAPKGSGYTTRSNASTKHKLPEGETYHISLGMCLNAQVPNLTVVGRCASSTHEGHSSVRVQTHCMVMGQSAGTCAAMALDRGVAMDQLPVRELQAALRADGVYLQDVPASRGLRTQSIGFMATRCRSASGVRA